MQPNKAQVAELRKNPMVQAWIASYQETAWFPDSHSDCRHCGWPHNKHVVCGLGATFGTLRIGLEQYYVDASNVEYYVLFRSKPVSGFHWRNDIFFERLADGTVEVRQFIKGPSLQLWRIPANEWASIVASVSTLGETAERWNAAQDFHGRTASEPRAEGSQS